MAYNNTDMTKLTGDIMRYVAKNYGLTNDKLAAEATKRVKTIFNDAVIGMQKDFEEDKITQEIDAGIASSNISNTLGGGDAPNNLFAFIGFQEGSNPTEPIRKALDPSNVNGPKLGKAQKMVDIRPRFRFEVSAPNLEAIHSATPLPWGGEGNMSWVEKIETYIPGYAKFLSRFITSEASRSGGGLQLKKDIHEDRFVPPQEGYLTRIFKNFITNVTKLSYRQRFR